MQNSTTHAQDFSIDADFQGVACTCGAKFVFGYPGSPMEMLREHIARQAALRAVAAHRRR